MTHMNLKNGTNKFIYKTEIDSDIENKLMITKGEVGRDKLELGINMYTLLYIKWGFPSVWSRI